MALGLKKAIIFKYPIAKILLKPLIFHENELSIESIFLRSRIGAFEVQVSTRTLKKLKKKTIFSKLNTRVWPAFDFVLGKLSEFMPKDAIHIKLLDTSKQLIEKDLNSQTMRLKGIKVALRPYRPNISTLPAIDTEYISKLFYLDYYIEMIFYKETLDSRAYDSNRLPTVGNFNAIGADSKSFATSRTKSAFLRPKSAYSTISNKTIGNIQKSLSRLARDDRSSHNSYKAKDERLYIEEANESGVVIFNDIPRDMYQCEVLENKEFLPETRVNFLINE